MSMVEIDREFVDFSELVTEHVPRRARILVFAIELHGHGDDPEPIRTVAELAVETGLSEAVCRSVLVRLVEDGLVAWGADGMRTTLPGRS